MLVIRKKYFILCFVVLFIVIILFLGSNIQSKKSSQQYQIGQVKKVSTNAVEHEDLMTNLRTERENVRKNIISKLSDTVNNVAADQQSRQLASEKINRIYDYTLKENLCEEIIRLKGFEDALVYIDDSSVNVSVKTDNLNQNDIIIIKDIIIDKTEINDIKIVAVN